MGKLVQLSTLIVMAAVLFLILSPVSGVQGKPVEYSQTISSGNVLFVMKGLPENYNFSLVINDRTYSSVGNTLNLSLPSGTYHYTVQVPYKYIVNKSSGNFNVSQKFSEIVLSVSPRGSQTVLLLEFSLFISVMAILIFLLAYIKYMKN